MLSQMQGRIIKGVGGFYEVLADGTIYMCRARGKFRRDKMTPAIGDYVDFTVGTGEELCSVDKILPRRNALKRPAVANIDTLVLVTCASDPEPDLLLLDKLLLSASTLDMEILLVINKCDLATPEAIAALAVQYTGAVAAVLSLSAQSGLGREALLERLQGRCSCLAGQSGVGKSSLLNCLFPDKELETGDISQRSSRGKHTTRHVELLPIPGGGEVADTPGFSLLEMEKLEPSELPLRYPEFIPYADNCRFDGCMHDSEPGCAVKAAAADGKIPLERMQRYKEILKETRETWRNRYD
jgi:ribosome biogenesis GTPase / thiamine phosphate phosphatase